jgi:transcriptional regulator with XRE-family HTH domain
MDKTQFRRLLKQAGLTQAAAARLIGITDRQMRRYTSGDTEPPLMAILALKYVIDQERLEAGVKK